MLPADIDETPLLQENPQDYVIRMAQQKAVACADMLASKSSNIANVIIASDTSVVVDDQILGKPDSLNDAKRMLRLLSGRVHQVVTSLCVFNPKNQHQVLSSVNTQVTFRSISDLEMEYYWRTGEPQDKAGAYAIQGHGAVFVESIQGSYSAVVGLPLYECAQILSQFGIHSLEEMSHE
ncbi:Maf family protein [Marinomonas sp. THO17]